jgi:hypothetical protein
VFALSGALWLPLPGSTHLVTQEGVIDTLLRLDLDFIKNSSTL